jgi:hypothetical protein
VSGARPIVRGRGDSPRGAIDVPALASIEVTSEQSLFPIDNVFDAQQGPGGSCWVAERAGEQLIVLRFHQAQDVASITIESEERGDTRTQRIVTRIAYADGTTRIEPVSQTFSFSPYGPSFHRATWELTPHAVASIRWSITPTPLVRRASLTSIVLR